MLKIALGTAAVLFSVTGPLAMDLAMGNANDAKWGAAPPYLPGAQLAVILGNPRAESGPYVVRLKFPANYKIAPHSHPKAEFVTVITGNFHVGMGEKVDEKSAHELTSGGFIEGRPNMPHYAWTTSETVIQIHGEAPLETNFVNPADDARKR